MVVKCLAFWFVTKAWEIFGDRLNDSHSPAEALRVTQSAGHACSGHGHLPDTNHSRLTARAHTKAASTPQTLHSSLEQSEGDTVQPHSGLPHPPLHY